MNKILLYCLAAFSFVACQTAKDKEFTDIKLLEKQLLSDDLQTKDSIAIALFDKYTMYAEKYADDQSAPDFLFKAGELANSIGMAERAIQLLSSIPQQYPKFDKAPESLFLCGFISENHIGNLEQAKTFYREFIQQYPNHLLRKDAELSLQNLGKSPEELIKEFEAKAQK